jgi:hypothetical protein
MRAWPIAAAVVAALLSANVAFAQDDSADAVPEEGDDGDSGEALERPPADGNEGRRRVAVVILASSGVDPETADALTELAIGGVATRGRVSIVGKEEFQAQLGQGEARSAECVTSTTCLGRVGVQLGVDELIAGTVARRGDRWVFNLNRIVIRTGELAGRIFREVEGDVGAVADAVQDAIPELYERVSQPGTLQVSANVEGAEVVVDGVLIGVYRGEPVQLTDVAPGRHELGVSAAGYFDWTRVVNVAEGATMQIEAALESPTAQPRDEGGISPLLWIGLGVGVVAGGLATYFGIASQAERDPGLNRSEAVDFVNARQTEATVANISIGVAIAGAGVAIIGFFLSDFGGGDEAPVSAGIAPLPDGAALSVRGRLP